MRRERLEHPAVVRLCHWLVALAIFVLGASGLEVFAAFPSFGEKIPEQMLFMPPAAVRLGGWLGGALQWHLTFAWLLIGAGVTHMVYQLASGNCAQVLFASRDARDVWPMIRHYFLLGPKPVETETYNPLQKLAYTGAIVLCILLATSGVALYKPVQLSWLVTGFGGFRSARIWHFAAMCGLAAFVPGHLVMVALHGWKNFASMWIGGSRKYEV
jgi:Ni/Fe-hydrogenase b-type cytochrome subunit